MTRALPRSLRPTQGPHHDVVVLVPGLPPASQSPNARCHWSAVRRDRDEFMQTVARAMLAAGVQQLRAERLTVTLEYVLPKDQRADVDNWLIRGMKPVGDTLVKLGVIVDDDRRHLTPTIPVFTVDPSRAPLTIVTLRCEP